MLILLRYLVALPLAAVAACFGLFVVPTRERYHTPFTCYRERATRHGGRVRAFPTDRASGRLFLSGIFNYDDDSNANENENENSINTNDAVVYAKSATSAGATSRRKALILSAATTATTLAAAAAGMETGAFTIPLSQQDECIDSDVNPNANSNPNANANKNHNALLLESSNVYRVQTTRSTTTATTTVPLLKSEELQQQQQPQTQGRPSVHKVTKERLLDDLQSKRAVFLGEHHPEGRDHRLQAALIRSLHDAIQSKNNKNNNNNEAAEVPTLVVGLEAVQRQFQHVLDKYCAGSIDEAEFLKATEWESRWYWSFEAYRPIFEICRELNIGLLALDIATEDRLLVETGGLEALGNKLDEYYIPDLESFSAFGDTLAYQEFVSYTLKPPYELQQRTALGNRANNKSKNNISFSNFVARQMLRDGGMASVATSWLSKNPNGVLVGCIGINHATFGCGVPGRVEKMLSDSSTPSQSRQRGKNGNLNHKPQKRMVASVLINPEPLNTGTELKICQIEGRPPINDDDDEDDDDNDSTTSSSSKVRQIFVPNTSNQVCIENSIELQNYALQLDYIPPNSSGDMQQRRTAMHQAAEFRQAKQGETVLGLSDYLVFSPKETSIY